MRLTHSISIPARSKHSRFEQDGASSSGCGTGGLYSQLARRTLPGFMAVDQLRNQQDSNEFLCLTFWTSFDTYSAAQKSSNAAALAHFLSKLTIFSANLWRVLHLARSAHSKIPGSVSDAPGRSSSRPATMLGYPPIRAMQREIPSRTASSRLRLRGALISEAGCPFACF